MMTMDLCIKTGIQFLLLLGVLSASAQINTSDFDSIPFSKPKRFFKIYEFNHPVLNKTSISSKQLKRAKNNKYSTKEAAKDLAGDFTVALFGGFIEVASSKGVEWLMSGTIHCNNEWLNWDIETYCRGELYKEKIREENMDGSKSVTTIKNVTMDWAGGASTFIIENEKAIGEFMLIRRPRNDILFYEANRDVFDEPKVLLKSAYKNIYYTNVLNRNLTEYALVGSFRNENFVLIANGRTRKMWFFVNNRLVCLFQPDLDDLEIRKKDRIMPYILIDSQITDSQLVDWFRLALVSKYLSTTIGKNSFSN
jgi:hypothetical protein